jgi:hypothetical protein
MAFNLSAAANILKNQYLGPVREQLNTQSILWSRLRKDFNSVSGKNITIPLHTGRNLQAGSGRGDRGALPTAGSESYSVATVPMKYIYTRIEVTGPTIDATRNDAGAFVKAIRSQMDGASSAHARSINRQLNSDGTDAVAFWTTADDTSGTNVDDNQGNAFTQIESGATYDLVDAGDNSTLNGNSIVVTLGAAGSTGTAITWSGTVSSSADSDFLVLEDTLGYQFMGIDGAISTSDCVTPAGGGTKTGLHGLAAASNPSWNAQSFKNSGTQRALTLGLMQKPLSEIGVKSDARESDVKFLLSNVYAKDEYLKLLVADKRHVNEMELDGGYSAVSFNNKPLIVDPQTKRNTIFYVTPKSMALYLMAEVDWRDFDGNIFRNVAGYDSYEAWLATVGDLGISARNQNGVLGDILEA